MPRLEFLDSARRDLADIAEYVARESQSRAIAASFTDQIIGYCERLARFPAMMGRARPELRSEYRSAVFGSYVIFLRYLGEANDPLAIMQVIHVLHGARDMDAYFGGANDNDGS